MRGESSTGTYQGCLHRHVERGHRALHQDDGPYDPDCRARVRLAWCRMAAGLAMAGRFRGCRARWLRPGFLRKGFDQDGREQRDHAFELDYRFNKMLKIVAGGFSHVRYVDLRGTLPGGSTYQDWWETNGTPRREGSRPSPRGSRMRLRRCSVRSSSVTAGNQPAPRGAIRTASVRFEAPSLPKTNPGETSPSRRSRRGPSRWLCSGARPRRAPAPAARRGVSDSTRGSSSATGAQRPDTHPRSRRTHGRRRASWLPRRPQRLPGAPHATAAAADARQPGPRA